MFLTKISAIEMKSIHLKHRFNELIKGRRRHSLVSALIVRMSTGFQSTIMRDRSTYTGDIHSKQKRLVICVGWKFKFVYYLWELWCLSKMIAILEPTVKV